MWAAGNKGSNLLDWLHVWVVVVVTLLFLYKYKWNFIFMIFVKVDQFFNSNLPEIPKNFSSTLKQMFSEAKLNFRQPGTGQWWVHPAEMEVRVTWLCLSFHLAPLAIAGRGGHRMKGEERRWWKGWWQMGPTIHSSPDVFSHLFGISRVIFHWASLRDMQAGEIVHLKGQEGEYTREVHLTRVVKCGCIN